MSDAMLTAAVPFPAVIGLESAALGSVTMSSFGSVNLGVHLPVFKPGEHHLFRPPDLNWEAPEPEYTNFGEHDPRPASPWGWNLADDPTRPVYGVSQVVVVTADLIPEAEVGATLKSVRDNFVRWFEVVKSWCEVLTEQDLDHLAPRQRFRFEGQGWSAWHGDKTVSAQGGILIDFDYGEPVTASQWDRILELAGASTFPAPEHLLIRDARGALKRHQYRRCVMDAATATEAALHRMLWIAYYEDPSPLGVAYTELADKWTLGTLITNLKDIVTMPAFTSDHIGIRNKAVHRDAKEPTEAQAKEWLALAAEAVNTATPLPAF